MAILVLGLLPFLPVGKFRGLSFYPLRKLVFWGLVGVFVLLTYVGANPVEAPFIIMGQLLRGVYFRAVIGLGYCNKL